MKKSDVFKVSETVGFNSKTPQWFQRDYSPNVTGVIKAINGNNYAIQINGIGKDMVNFPKENIKKL